MTHTRLVFGLLVLVYAAAWVALAALLWVYFFQPWIAGLPRALYCFLSGLWLLVASAVRSLRTSPVHRRHDPLQQSLGLSGILLLLMANLV